MEQMKGNTDSSENQLKWTKSEIAKYFLIKFFKRNPESAEEKDIKEVELLKIVLSFYDQCCELLEKESEYSEILRIARKNFNWNHELSSKCCIKEVTFAAETLLLEYEICAHEVGDTEIKEVKPVQVDEKELADPPRHQMDKCFFPRSVPECVEVLIGVYYHVDRISEDLNQKLLRLKDGSNPVEKKDVMETDDSKKDFSATKDDLVAKILNQRMNFTYNMQLFIRAALLLFKRVNQKWINPEEEKVLEATAKRDAFATTKVASTDSSVSVDNPPSVSSSTDNPASVPSFSDNPSSVASSTDNPSSVPSFSDNPSSIASSSGTEAGELPSVVSQESCPMEVDS